MTTLNDVSLEQDVMLSDILENGSALSPRLYRRPHIGAKKAPLLEELLAPDCFDKGVEPGSASYVCSSPRRLIRTKAMKSFSMLPYPAGDAIVPVMPTRVPAAGLDEWSLLLCKDSNVGEVCITEGPEWKDYAFSSGIVRVNVARDPWYVFAVMKHPIFKAQLEAMTPRGSTISHAGKRWMKCRIPYPSGREASEVVSFVSGLVEAIVAKEREIRHRSAKIHATLDAELLSGRSPTPYAYPRLEEILRRGRLDAAVYGSEYKDVAARLDSYPRGVHSPSELGFRVHPGPTLEIKVIKTRIDSDTPRPGFYTLLLPKNLSEFGTINKLQYLGTPKALPILRRGDVLIGEAGFEKGRSVVLTRDMPRLTTNAHGLYARRESVDLSLSILFRCVFSWYRYRGILDLMAVGGSGGHLSPSYFDEYVRIPDLPPAVVDDLVNLYQTDAPDLTLTSTDDLVAKQARRNLKLGIANLADDVLYLKGRLRDVLDAVVEGRPARMP